MNKSLLRAAVFLLLSACGSDGSSSVDASVDSEILGDGGTLEDSGLYAPDYSLPDMGPEIGVSRAALPGTIAALLCADTCPLDFADGRLPRALLVQGEPEICVERLTLALDAAFAAGSLVNAGVEVAYDPVAAEACLDRLAATTCGAALELFGAAFCGGGVFSPTTQVGDVCDPAGVDVCPAGTYCRVTNDTDACGGFCEDVVALGAACSSHDACGPAARCLAEDAEESPTCRSITVAPTLAAESASCGLAIDGTAATFTRCEDDLRCDDGICVVAPGVGELCDSETNPCRGALVCAEGTCQAVTYVAELDGSCGLSVGVPFLCDPLAGLACVRVDEETLVTRCEAFGDGTAGARCSPPEVALLVQGTCSTGLYCRRAAGDDHGTCVALLGDAEECASDDQCESGFCDTTGESPYCAEPFCIPE